MIYIMLCNITPQTQQLMKDNPDFLYSATENIGDNNNNILSHYFTLGRYDIIIIAQADSHIQAAKMSINISDITGLNIETLPTIIFNRLEEEATNTPTDPPPTMSEPVYQTPNIPSDDNYMLTKDFNTFDILVEEYNLGSTS